MKHLKQDDGFTLIEILVSINVAFILITLIVSVYLFTTNFIGSTIRKVEKDDEAYNYLNYLDVKLRKNGIFSLTREKDAIYFSFNNRDTLFVYAKKERDFVFNELQKIKVRINTTTGEAIEYSSETERLLNGVISTNSSDIKNITMLFTFKNRDYRFFYSPMPTSTIRFKNTI
jgi:Tfp pilus assembly protein PilW